jgi:hypothetical protein
MSNGFIAYRGPSTITGEPIVGIVTYESRNAKTGNIAQLYILPEDISPHDEVYAPGESRICGYCPMRGVCGKDRGCYVSLFRGPRAIWNAYRRGTYDDRPHRDYAGIRLGAYGDPAAIPYPLVAKLITGRRWTGYTHQWRYCDQRFKQICMASVSPSDGLVEAVANDWRCFIVLPKGTDIRSITLPFTKIRHCFADKHGDKCLNCMACNGTLGGNTVSFWIHAHGPGAKHVR